jgi:hypothetical protein
MTTRGREKNILTVATYMLSRNVLEVVTVSSLFQRSSEGPVLNDDLIQDIVYPEEYD